MYKILSILLLCSMILYSKQLNYVGNASCVVCHDKETHEWKGSHHDLAMQIADDNTVKADFNNTTFNYNGIVSTFYKKDAKFMVNTDGPDGKLHDYEIAYTFGVYPLQQYMIKFPEGRVQVLDPTWDSRPKEEGGQRWYHIHADDNVTAGDVLHWTGPNMNWNYMCADCHSTNLKKNYNVKTKSYHTTWSSINVSCESCHGPASGHIAWTKQKESNVSNSGFPLSLKYKIFDENRTKSYRDKELNVCAKCHSRRSQLDDNITAGDNFYNHYLPVNLDENRYFPDGKIEDEVYVYNSFLQSKMYAKGVTCTDCHNPHTLKRKAQGDTVCYQCHTSKKYTSTKHHFHKEGSKGSACISCHMPARTYMGVDSRNDHSFRIPRPDISVEMKEIPNACNLCHTDKNAKWASDAVKKWYGKTPVGKQNFAHALQALRTNAKDAPKGLYSILTSDAPSIAKVTATTYLRYYPSKQTYVTTLQMLRNDNASMRRAALLALEGFPPKIKANHLFEMLDDPVKIVRMEAARQLASMPTNTLEKKRKSKLQKVWDEYEKILLFTAERPESQLSLALFYQDRGMNKKAENAYKEALRLQSQLVPIYVNYSYFLDKEGRRDESYKILNKGIETVPDTAILYHAKGLWYINNKQKDKALELLKKAVTLDENNARFSYVYAVALGEKSPKEAIKILENIYPKHTGNAQVVSGLAYYYKQTGQMDKSIEYEQKLQALQHFIVR